MHVGKSMARRQSPLKMKQIPLRLEHGDNLDDRFHRDAPPPPPASYEQPDRTRASGTVFQVTDAPRPRVHSCPQPASPFSRGSSDGTGAAATWI